MRSASLNSTIETGRLFEPDTLMTDQFYSTFKRGRMTDPELRLMAAILEDAVSCISKARSSEGWQHKRSAEEAECWINTEGEEDWIFSFTNVCETLGLDPDYMRRGLSSWSRAERHAARETVIVKKYRSGPRRRRLRFRPAI